MYFTLYCVTYLFVWISFFYIAGREREKGGGRGGQEFEGFWSSHSDPPLRLYCTLVIPPHWQSIFPSPNPTLTLTRYQLTVVKLGEGTMFETTDPWYGWSTNSTGRNLMNTTNTKVVLLITLLESHPGWCINLRASYSLKMLHRLLNLKFLLTSGWE